MHQMLKLNLVEQYKSNPDHEGVVFLSRYIQIILEIS